MWVQSSVWLFTMKEYNKTLLIWSPRNFMIWRVMKLDLELYFDVSKLDVWLDVFEFWFGVEGRWLDLELNWRKIPTLIRRIRNEPWFWESKGALLDLEMTLYFGRVSVGFFSPSFLIWETSIYRQLNSIWFGIVSQHLLRINYEFNLVFHLIRTFHIGFFFWRCHMTFLFDVAMWLDFIC